MNLLVIWDELSIRNSGPIPRLMKIFRIHSAFGPLQSALLVVPESQHVYFSGPPC